MDPRIKYGSLLEIKRKILTLDEVPKKQVILCHGCFDLLHPGHLRYFQWARLQEPGSELCVTLTADKYFPTHKTDTGPAFSQDVRAEWLAHLEFIDYVSIVNEPTAVLAIQTIQPIAYCKGWEAKGVIPQEEAAAERVGARMFYMEKESIAGQLWSSGRILDGDFSRRKSTQKNFFAGKSSKKPIADFKIGEGEQGVE